MMLRRDAVGEVPSIQSPPVAGSLNSVRMAVLSRPIYNNYNIKIVCLVEVQESSLANTNK